MKNKWWMDTIIYQIYLRSFKDSNGDGIGDINGVIEKLDYLKDLGIGCIWISPHYDSPMDDNGYDVRDYYKVSKDYGTIDDFKKLIDETHKRGMKIITDLVLNHTSDEHEWFKKAIDKTDPEYDRYHDYYIWQKPKLINGKKEKPTRWIGWFGDSAWEYVPSLDEYYLHIFTKKMPDLNWRNKNMREDMKKMIKWWVNLGIDGFRVDASNHLEKNWDFPDAYPGYENFSSLPKHHEYLEELGKEIFVPNDLLIIGEAGGANKDECLKYARFNSNEFNMLIQFGHTWADTKEEPIYTNKWSMGEVKTSLIKNSFDSFYKTMYKKGWYVIYWANHDQPRVVSHYGNDKKMHDISAKMLAMTLYFMPGTPICYYGEEIGMTNVDYKRIDDFKDVEVFIEYKNFLDRGATPKDALNRIKKRSRDNSRTPMQWSTDKNAGFSNSKPWMKINKNYMNINVDNELNNEDSVLNTYKKIFELRNENKDIAHGHIKFYSINSNSSYVYINETKKADYLVIANFKSRKIKKPLRIKDLADYKLLMSNCNNKDITKPFILNAYECLVYKKDK